MTTRFPWRRVMMLGLGVLRLPPDAFWRMTLREFDAVLATCLPAPSVPTGRDDLRELMTRFPDEDER